MTRDEYYDPLQHHGILGQKWGIRRFQNSDGTLTAAGKARLAERNASVEDGYYEMYRKQGQSELLSRYNAKASNKYTKTLMIAGGAGSRAYAKYLSDSKNGKKGKSKNGNKK